MNQLQTITSMNIADLDTLGDLSEYSNIDNNGLLNHSPQNRVSMAGKLWTFNNADGTKEPGPSGPMQVVILNVSPFTNKSYYEKGYNPEESAPPDCSSANGKAPDGWIERPQANNCATCPKNQPNSSKDGNSRACKDGRWIAILPSTKLSSLTPYALSLPVTSIMAFRDYVTDLTARLKAAGKFKDSKKANPVAPLELFITNLSFKERGKDGKALTFPVIEFACEGVLSNELQLSIKTLGASDEVKKLIRIDEESVAAHRLPSDAVRAAPAPTTSEDIPFTPVPLPTPAPAAPIAKPASQMPGFGTAKVNGFATKTPAAPAPAPTFAAPLPLGEIEDEDDIEKAIDAHLAKMGQVDEFAL